MNDENKRLTDSETAAAWCFMGMAAIAWLAVVIAVWSAWK